MTSDSFESPPSVLYLANVGIDILQPLFLQTLLKRERLKTFIYVLPSNFFSSTVFFVKKPFHGILNVIVIFCDPFNSLSSPVSPRKIILA